MTRRPIRARALLCLLGWCLTVALPATEMAQAAPGQRERIALIALPTEDPCGCTPFLLGDFDLESRVGQPLGVLNLFGIPTSPPEVPDDDALGIVTLVASLPDGSIVGQGQFPLDGGPAKVAIVGGTGRYRRARGFARLVPRPQGFVRVVMHVLQ